MDFHTALEMAENSLRDFIGAQMRRSIGTDWTRFSGLSDERIVKLEARKADETVVFEGGPTESRLLYFSDLHDLKKIVIKNWPLFEAAFKSKPKFEFWLETLMDLRNPEAHRRGLLSHQEALAIGISGELRAAIMLSRANVTKPEDCFPQIESAFDSLGTTFNRDDIITIVRSDKTLFVGDTLEVNVAAIDPLGTPLEFHFYGQGFDNPWSMESRVQLVLAESNIARNFFVICEIRSQRSYHAQSRIDDSVTFSYTVLPTSAGTA